MFTRSREDAKSALDDKRRRSSRLVLMGHAIGQVRDIFAASRLRVNHFF
jgi:hypothetical protein